MRIFESREAGASAGGGADEERSPRVVEDQEEKLELRERDAWGLSPIRREWEKESSKHGKRGRCNVATAVSGRGTESELGQGPGHRKEGRRVSTDFSQTDIG